MNADPLHKRAFTLIELLIVITIIGILAVALIPRLIGGPARARDAQRQADLQQIASALELVAQDNGSYPYYNGCIFDNTGVLNMTHLSTYLTTVPSDPSVTVTAGTSSVEITRGNCSNGYGYIGLQGGGAVPTTYGTFGAKGYILTTDLETETIRLSGVYQSAVTITVNNSAATNFASATSCATSCGASNVIYLLGR